MAYSVDTNTRTPITQLREALDKAERLIVQVNGGNIAELLTLLDDIERQFEVMGEDYDVRPEQSRWESLLSRVNTKPNPIVHAANVAGGMDKLRAAHPPAQSFWWHLDAEVTKRRISAVRRLITTVVVVVVLAVGGYWAINFFFPPNPEAVMMVDTNNSLDRLIADQKWQEGLDLVESARAQYPENVELIIWEAVLYERLGNSEAAAAALAEAQQASPDQPIQVLIYLGTDRQRVGDMEGAKAAGDQALKIDPNEPQAYFLLGSVAESQGDIGTAINYFEQTSTLAEGKNPQLAVIARVRMGQLMQNPGSISPEATPSATP